ncbi:hypothetical protein ES288_A01G152400v1 [Gossypium darwinii]|uniref:RRM domain-containing protein n=1 Tax=Gossypium darwinii TaxID=34276 RepID=A0A5D2HM97_GOSDA|nr:hypothetical protein ES288_A01G152400v1 [Gossypium darwinii]
MESGDYQITMFVFNIPVTMHWKGLWTLFIYHGKVVDAFIPEKKSKCGKRFGFVRFINFLDAQTTISRLNGFVILGCRIWVKIARFKGRREIWRRATMQQLLDILKQRKWSYLKEFFIHIKSWSEKIVFSKRVTWIEIFGVPMHCWNYETFKRVAGKWGTLLSMEENLSGIKNFENIEMLISITQLKKVEEVVLLEVGDIKFSVSLWNFSGRRFWS